MGPFRYMLTLLQTPLLARSTSTGDHASEEYPATKHEYTRRCRGNIGHKSISKQLFADRQLLPINTTRSLKCLEEYPDRQALIWKIFSKHENIPDDISDLHLHIDNFKINIQKEFNFLKEATRKNVENFQTSLNLQQTYSVALGSHISNIYHKILEIQQQLPHPTQHMNAGDVIQINTPEFDPDIYGKLPMKEQGKYRGQMVLYNIF